MKNKFNIMPSDNRRQFDFMVDSIADGEVVTVHKCVLFDYPDHKGRTNVALVDILGDGSLSDSTRSGYGQTEEILGAVANCIFDFLNTYPSETVSFQGSDPEGKAIEDKMSLRQILYNRTLSKKDNYELAGNHFVIYGVYTKKGNDDDYEEYIDLYKPNSRASVFLIQLRK